MYPKVFARPIRSLNHAKRIAQPKLMLGFRQIGQIITWYFVMERRASQLDAFEQEFSCRLPEAFGQLYQWHDGQDPMASDAISGNRSFMSLDEIRDSKRELDGMNGLDFEDPKYWRRGWIPFLHNGAEATFASMLRRRTAGNRDN